MTILNLNKDVKGFNTYLRAPSENKYSMSLTTAGGEQTVTAPAYADKFTAIFSYEPGGEVWVAINATAASPSGAVAVSTSELNPVGYELKAGDVIHLITPDVSVNVGVVFYAV